jgi:ribosomal protein L18
MKQFRTYTLGRKVTLLSDHHALQYLTTKAHLGNRRLQNWALTVQDCLGEVLYVPGKDMVVPDALSRLDPTTEPEQYLAERASVKALSARDSVIQAQAADAVIAAVKAKLENDTRAGNRKGAELIGRTIAERLKEKGITRVVFDRNGFLYHGRVRAVAEAARSAGLEF